MDGFAMTDAENLRRLRSLSAEDLWAFTATLSSRDWRKLTSEDCKKIVEFIQGDGCTGVPDFYKGCCDIHDWWFRTHRNLDGSPIAEAQANLGLKRCIQSKSLFGRWSPMAWWRWRGVKALGKRAWR